MFLLQLGNQCIWLLQVISRKNHNVDKMKSIDWKDTRTKIPNGAVKSNLLDNDDKDSIATEDLLLIFLCCERTYQIPHQVGFQRITRESLDENGTCLSGPEKAIDLNVSIGCIKSDNRTFNVFLQQGHIIGYAPSKDRKLLYVNVRSWPEGVEPDRNEPEEPPPISDDVVIHVIDLENLTLLPQSDMKGHKGFTPPTGAFLLYLNTTESFLLGGSEDSHGYVWDQRYQCLLKRLPHEKCVNVCVASPVDEQVCVTGSDDHKIKLWVSTKRKRSMMAESKERK